MGNNENAVDQSDLRIRSSNGLIGNICCGSMICHPKQTLYISSIEACTYYYNYLVYVKVLSNQISIEVKFNGIWK